jgi:hypothetical protein
MTLLGLRDDYQWDGRAIAQMISGWALPRTIRENRRAFDRLAAVYKQLDAPFGEFGMSTLDANTSAIESGTNGDDSTYVDTDDQLQACDNARAQLLPAIQAALQAAESGRRPVTRSQARSLIAQAERLIDDGNVLARSSSQPPARTVCR